MSGYNRGKHKYLNEFKTDDTGKYVYTGKYYSIEKKEPKGYVLLWVLTLVPFVFHLVFGLIYDERMDNLFILLPFGLSLVLIISLLWGLLRLSFYKNKIPEYVLLETFKKIPQRAGFAIFFSFISAVGSLYFGLIRHFLFEGLSLVFLSLLILFQKKLSLKVTEL